MNDPTLPDIAPPLLSWYDVHKRTLPWRGAKGPYQIWVSEIMLQQTRVAAVIPYYKRWMEALPDVTALAGAEEGRLMKLWEGLGYYSRARNLQKAARMIVTDLDGLFPGTYERLLALPGVGDYTAGAIASMAFGEAVPAVDGNVLRILSRVLAFYEDIMDPRVRRRLRETVQAAVPPDRPGAFNQALMDLGAMVCLPNSAPLCGQCPLQGLCTAQAQGAADQLPIRKKKARRRIEELTVYLLFRQGQVALRQRPAEGLLGGLWEFPHVNATATMVSYKNKERLVNFFKGNGLYDVTFSILVGCTEKELFISYKDFLAFMEYVKGAGLKSRQFRDEKCYDCTMYGKLCGVGRTNIFITPEGIYPCGRFYKMPDYYLGAYDAALDEIEEQMRRFTPVQDGKCYYIENVEVMR